MALDQAVQSFSFFADEVQRLCEEGQLHKAFDALACTDKKGIAPSVEMYVALLKACSKRQDLAAVRKVQSHMMENGMEPTSTVGEFLVSALVQCNSFEEAIHLHRTLPLRTVISWTALIAGYTRAGQGHEALRMYRFMLEEGVQPDTYTLSSLLKACASTGDLVEGKYIHGEAIKHKCESSLVVGTCLVDMYAKCGSVVDSRAVFDGLSRRDVVSWTAMLAGYAQQERADEALSFYEQLLAEGITPNAQTFVSVLQACARLAETEEYFRQDIHALKMRSLHKGRAIHAEACRTGNASHVFVGNAIVSMYWKCGSVLDAWNTFRGLPRRDTVSWNSMLAGYAQEEIADKVLELYSNMSEEGITPNARTFVTTLQACAMLAEMEEGVCVNGLETKVQNLAKGKDFHALVWKRGYKHDAFIGTMLVSMYGKCGSIVDAEEVFHELLIWDTVASTAMTMAYTQQGYPEKALELYGQATEEGVNPVDRTFVAVLQACGMVAEEEEEVVVDSQPVKLESLQKGKAIHAELLRWGYESDAIVGNVLMNMYGKCGSIVDAKNVFDGLSDRDVVSWNVMLAAYGQQGLLAKAVELYGWMQAEGISPNEVTFLHILDGCSKTGSLDLCVQTHSDIVATEENMSPVLASALIHAYGRCGSMTEARIIFERLTQPAVVSWNALIAGYARQGDCKTLFDVYQKMLLAGVKPNAVTFLSLIHSCSHAGMVGTGLEYFESMSRDYGITPGVQHYVSIVDLLGRAGHFNVVEDLLFRMPVQPNLSMWLCLLGACQKHGNVWLATHAFYCAVDLQPMVTSAYTLMSNIFGDARMWTCARMVNELRQQAGAWKKPGQSWIEHEQEVQRFDVGCQQQDVHELVRRLSVELNSHFLCRHPRGQIMKLC